MTAQAAYKITLSINECIILNENIYMVAKNTHIKNNTNTKMLDRRQHDTFIFIHEKYIVKKKKLAMMKAGRYACRWADERATRRVNITLNALPCTATRHKNPTNGGWAGPGSKTM